MNLKTSQPHILFLKMYLIFPPKITPKVNFFELYTIYQHNLSNREFANIPMQPLNKTGEFLGLLGRRGKNNLWSKLRIKF